MRFLSSTIPQTFRIAVLLVLLTTLRKAWMVLSNARSKNYALQTNFVFSEQPLKYVANKGFHKFTRSEYVQKQSDSKSSMQCINSSVENPGNHLHFLRFDVIIKLVYAYYYSMDKFVPYIFKHAYSEHLRVWNNFHEYCTNRHPKSFDASMPCKPKSSENDFVSSFHHTIDSIREHGFESNSSQIPTDVNGVILNGAHRLAASTILCRNATFQFFNTSARFRWNYLFFEKQGLQRNISDLAMLEWMKLQLKLPQVSRKVFILSIFSDSRSLDDTVRKTVSQKCSIDNGILYEKTISLAKLGISQLVRHMYGNKPWLPGKIRDMLSLFKRSQFTVVFIFFFAKTLDELKDCKYAVRKLYNYQSFKSSAHIPDSLQENYILSQMILNPNSVLFLNYGQNGMDCLGIAAELARRSSLQPVPTLPGLYVGRDDLMIDSGSVMHIFNLRNRTDVDILFLHNIDMKILGNRNGFHMEAHAFKANVVTGRPWGEDHFSNTVKSKWDLFYDPSNFGFCYGIKFVSLNQLIKYKLKRNEPLKDNRDAKLIREFLSHT